MLRTAVSYVQMGFIGFCIGSFLGFVVFKFPLAGFALSTLIGLLFVGGVLAFIGERFQRYRRPVHIGLAGVFPGILLGGYINTWLAHPYFGTILGALYGFLVFALFWYSVITFLERRQWYVPYVVETAVFFLLSLVGGWFGFSVVPNLDANASFWKQGLIFVVPFIVSGMLSLLPGIIFSRNRNRPLFSSVLGILSGSLVLWVGINVSPFLFLPGSGLMWAGLVLGTLMIAVSVLAMVYPQHSSVLGGLLIFFSVLSFVGATGGLIIGGLVGILAGSLTVAWRKPQPVSQAAEESRASEVESVTAEVAVAKDGGEGEALGGEEPK